MSKQQTRGFFCLLLVLCVPHSPVAAQVRFTATSVNLGELKTGVPTAHIFRLENKSNQMVKITSVRGSCGCVAPQLTTQIIPPNRSGVVGVELNTLGQPAGPHRWYVFVRYFVGEEEREASLEVLANLVSEVNVTPSKLVFHLTGSVQQTIQLVDTRKNPLSISAVQSSSPHIRCHLQPMKATGKKTVLPIQLSVSDKFADGKHEAFVTVYTDDALYNTMKIPIVVFKSSRKRIDTTPREVEFRIAKNRPVSSRLLYIRDTMDMATQVREVRVNHPCLKVRWAPGPGSSTTVRVQVDRDRLPDRTSETSIEFELTEPEPHVLVVPVRFLVIED